MLHFFQIISNHKINMSELLSENVLLGMGNPLLDISATVKPELLTKHNLKANDAILTEEEQIFNDLVGEYKVDYIAGGATQNSIRVAQWILSKPNVTSYMGCVGDDDNSKKLEEKAKEAGVNVRYLQKNLPLLSVSQRVIRGGGLFCDCFFYFVPNGQLTVPSKMNCLLYLVKPGISFCLAQHIRNGAIFGPKTVFLSYLGLWSPLKEAWQFRS